MLLFIPAALADSWPLQAQSLSRACPAVRSFCGWNATAFDAFFASRTAGTPPPPLHTHARTHTLSHTHTLSLTHTNTNTHTQGKTQAKVSICTQSRCVCACVCVCVCVCGNVSPCTCKLCSSPYLSLSHRLSARSNNDSSSLLFFHHARSPLFLSRSLSLSPSPPPIPPAPPPPPQAMSRATNWATRVINSR